MTTPFPEMMQSYVLSPKEEGHRFAYKVLPAGGNTVPLPLGVNVVSVTCSSASAVIVQFRQPGETSTRPSRLQIPAGTEQRTVVAEVPVSREGSNMSFTMPEAKPEDVNQPVIGVRIFPTPPAT